LAALFQLPLTALSQLTVAMRLPAAGAGRARNQPSQRVFGT
jgi:hypothetical protein